MTASTEQVRLSVYHHFAETGRTSTPASVAARLGLPEPEARAAFDTLQAERHLALDASGGIVMAHPFATESFGISVMGARVLWWGGCAWDAFAIPHLVDAEPSVTVATTCQGCGAAHAWQVDRTQPPAGDQLVHFLTPMGHVWDDVVHACQNQRIFCDDTCLSTWLTASGHERGATFDLATLWRLASGWYAGRMEAGYTRREPVEAAAYFASVGLRGAFWGTPEPA